MTTNQLISQFHTAALLCEVAVGFCIDILSYRKINIKINVSIHFARSKTIPTQLRYIEVLFALRYRF
jgi:hypothetical protein